MRVISYKLAKCNRENSCSREGGLMKSCVRRFVVAQAPLKVLSYYWMSPCLLLKRNNLNAD